MDRRLTACVVRSVTEGPTSEGGGCAEEIGSVLALFVKMAAAQFEASGLWGKFGAQLYWPEKKLRVCITGAGGFIASHLARRLKLEGHYIVAVDWKANEHMTVRGRAGARRRAAGTPGRPTRAGSSALLGRRRRRAGRKLVDERLPPPSRLLCAPAGGHVLPRVSPRGPARARELHEGARSPGGGAFEAALLCWRGTQQGLAVKLLWD